MRNTDEHQQHWNQKYSSGNTHADYEPDSDLLRLKNYLPTQGKALDIACGTGRNSFFLAQLGLQVTAMDFSQAGLSFLEQHKKQHPQGQMIQSMQVDLSRHPLGEQVYDLIIVVRYLDRNAFASYIKALKAGGLLFFKAFNQNHLQRNTTFNPDYLLLPGELIEQFSAHEIIDSNDRDMIEDYESMLLLRKH